MHRTIDAQYVAADSFVAFSSLASMDVTAFVDKKSGFIFLHLCQCLQVGNVFVKTKIRNDKGKRGKVQLFLKLRKLGQHLRGG